MAFEKGNKFGKGRPPVLLPEVQRAIDANRNAIKTGILAQLDGKVVAWIDQIIERGINDGDVIKFKMLLELALGKMVDDPPDFPLSEEEKVLVLEYRRRKLEHAIGSSNSSD